MPFCRARLSAKRFIAGVGGNVPVAVADRSAKQGRPAGGAAFLELADDALGDIAHCVYRTDHLLLADNDIVEQAFKLRRHPRIDQGRVGLFENTEQRQAGLGRHDVLSLGNQETLFLQPPMISARVAGVPMPLASFRRSRRTSSSTKRQAFCIASIRVPSL